MDIRKEIKNIAATNSEETAVIGYLNWYTISMTGIKSYDLERMLQRYGLLRYMLKPRNPADAARCAMTDSAVSKSVDNSVTNKLFFVEVCSDKNEVIWKLVAEEIDKMGKRLLYDPNVATVRFDKETNTPEIQSCTLGEAISLIHSAFDLYREYRGTYTAKHIRDLVSRMMSDLSPIPVRPSGGVYFIPARHESALDTLISCINEFGDSESYKIPLINTVENKDMVRKKLNDYILNTVRDVAEFLKTDKIEKGVANAKLQTVKKVMGDFKEYQKELELAMGDMAEVLDLLKQQSMKLLDRLAA